MMLSSRTNPALSDLRDAPYTNVNASWPPGIPMLTRIEEQERYLSESFGRVALNDGSYTAEEITHALLVLNRLLAVAAL